MQGWIKLYRRFLKWEWFEDEKMVKLFIYLLLSVNFEDKKWRGIDVKRGQMITGRKVLSKEREISFLERKEIFGMVRPDAAIGPYKEVFKTSS